MYYTMQNKTDIKVHTGDKIEVLEAYYHKYSDKVMVRKLRHNGHVYELTLPLQSNVDLVKLKAHEGYVEEIKRSPKMLILHISLLTGENENSGHSIESYRTRH